MPKKRNFMASSDKTRKIAVIGESMPLRGLVDFITEHHADWILSIQKYHNVFFGIKTELLGPLEDFDGDGFFFSDHTDFRHESENVASARSTGVPVVFATPFHYKLQMPSVLPDNHAIAQLQANHLINIGLRNFAFFGFEQECEFLYHREQEFGKVLREKGFDCHVFRESEMPFNNDQTHPALKRFNHWLMHLPKPIGIATAYDGLSFLLSKQCDHLGISIPDEVAIVGAMNLQMSITNNPPLSTIELDQVLRGFKAAELLNKLINGGKAPVEPILIPPQRLIIRKSSDVPARCDEIVLRCLELIRTGTPGKITLNDLLDSLEISQRNLELRFKKYLGFTPASAIRQGQIEYAKQLLGQTNLPIIKIAIKCHFSSQSYFNQVFRKYAGQTPGSFRKTIRMSD